MTKRHYNKELLNAVNKRCFKKVQSIVAKGRDINLPLTAKGETALQLAVIQNDLSLIKLVLSLGADVNRTTNKKETTLHLAMDNDNPAKAKAKQGLCFNQRNEDLVKFLLSQLVDVDAQDVSGQSVLHIAVMSSNEKYVNLLLKSKIDVNLTMNNGSTALHCAVADFVDSTARISIVKSLVESGAQINIQNKMGETALYLAVRMNSFDLASYLISKGADVNCKTRTQLTAMFAAIKHCNLKIMRLLIKNGAEVNVINNAGDNLLHYALKKVGKDSEEVAEEDDYSASACAIIQRRNSSRRHSRRKRRPSSPFSPDAESALRRRSSVFTTSSGDTAISIDEGGEEQILDNLKLHKEVLHGVKQQPWPLRKKLKLVRQAKAYVRKHEGALQERLAQTRSTRDAIARASILLTKKWQYFKRELVNFKTVLVPWERRIKQIESQFGSAVASYFIFLRWLFWINLVISAALVTFVAIPELLATLQNATIAGERKIMLPEEQVKSTHLLTLWEFEGYLKYSPFFYGWYANQHTYKAYKLPLAYFVVNLVVYTYSFVAILRKMAKNSRMSKLSEKEDECAFSWKLFTGWDFMIGNAETAHNRIGSIVLGLKEALLEESEKHRDERNWKIMSIRVFVNMLVIALLAVSAYAVVEVVERSEDIRAANSSWWRQNEITVVMTLITYSFPILFEVLGIIESYHPRKQLRLQLGRIMVLNLLNMYSLIYALFKKINSSDKKLQSLKPNDSITLENCFNRLVPCESNVLYAASTLATMSLVLSSNFSSNSNKTLNSMWPNTLNSHETTNHTLPNDNILNISQEIFPLHEFDANSIFSDWTTEGGTFDSNVTLFSNPANFSLPGIDNATEIWDSPDNFTHSGLKVRNYLRDIDENPIDMDENAINPDENAINVDENLINIDDNYPHVNYNDYGFLDVDNKTGNWYSGLSTENAMETTTSNVVSSKQFDNPAVSTANSCGDVERVIRCYERICTNKTYASNNFSVSTTSLDIKTRRLLRGLCWETMFGQEIAKLTMMDLVLTIFSTMGMDFFRALFVRYMNSCWCWDLEKQFPQYGDFKIAENILHLVNNQGMVWMGIFFSPGLIVLNVIKLIILMYLRSWTVLTCNVPHEIVFRASRSNNFYLALLLTMLFLCVLPVGYAIVWVEPSWHCGPFSGYKRIYYLATSSLRNALPTYIHEVLDYIASPGIVIPLIVLMALIIYYMVSLTNSLRESNNDLKIQLRQERTEERRKMFKIAEKRLESHDTPFTRWKKILPATNKSVDLPSIVKLDQADQVAEAAAAITEAAIVEDREQKRSGGSDNGELTEGEQESLPNDQIPETTRKESNDSPKRQKANASYRKNGWRASRTKESPPESGESSEGVVALIPRIRISIEEPPSEAAAQQISASSDPTHARRKCTNSDHHSQ